MKVVILAGGYGTRISEESHLRPKPMVEIGERPILWHIMKIFSSYGFNEFVICLGYKGYFIKEYFAHYYLHEADITFDFRHDNQSMIHNHSAEPWMVTLVNTGLDTMTGGRVKRIQPYIGKEPFMLTYGDGVADINISTLYEFHKQHKRTATVTAIQPGARFGVMDLNDQNNVLGFCEKPQEDGNWINGGFFIFQPEIFNYLTDDDCILEQKPLETLAMERQLVAYRHSGFWQPMDSLRDKRYLEELWRTGQAPWKVWE